MQSPKLNASLHVFRSGGIIIRSSGSKHMAPRQGSRKATVYRAFISDGLDAAIAIGVSAGLKIGTIRSWAGGWSKTTTAPDDEAPAQVKPPKAGNIKVKWTERPARLLARGEQVSEIKWLDTGTTQNIPNDQLANTAKPD